MLADEGRTQRAHRFLDPVLTAVARGAVALTVLVLVVVMVVTLGGVVCLLLGLHGVGPTDGSMLTRLGVAGVGLGSAATMAGAVAARRRWRAWRNRP